MVLWARLSPRQVQHRDSSYHGWPFCQQKVIAAEILNEDMRHALLALVWGTASLALALDGDVGIHDPSTVVVAGGKFYTYGTGGTSLVSDDGWTWRKGSALPLRQLAPDVIHIGGIAITSTRRRTVARPRPTSA